MSRHGQLVSLVFIIYLASVSCTQFAKASKNASNNTLEDTSVASMLPSSQNGTQLLDDMIQHVTQMGDYKYDASVRAVKGQKIVRASGTFYYKPLAEVRVEVKDYGAKSGSILVKQKDGKIVAKGGRAMLGVTMALPPDSRLLLLPNGISAVNSDLLSLFNMIKKDLSSDGKIVAGTQPIKVNSLNVPVIVLEGQKPAASGSEIVERLFVDPKQKLPLQWDIFNKGKFSSRANFESFKTGLHFNEAKFNI